MGIELNNFNIYLDACSTKDGAEDVGNSAVYEEHPTDNNLKKCLKSKILEKRKQLGLGKLVLDFTPKESYPMTEEEKEKDRKRRESNRKSAHKSRQKQKEENEKNELLLQQLKEEHRQLLMRYKKTETERNKYANALQQILPDSKIRDALMHISHEAIDTCEINGGLTEAEFGHQEMEPEILPDVANTVTISSKVGDIYNEDVQIPYELDTSNDSSLFLAGDNYVAEQVEVREVENIINEENFVFQPDKSCESDMPETYYVIRDDKKLDLQHETYVTADGSILYTSEFTSL